MLHHKSIQYVYACKWPNWLIRMCFVSTQCLVYKIMLNKNTWGVKKVRGQEEPATIKALISNKAKKSVNESAT